MVPDREKRRFELVHEALGWPPEERAQRLEEACADGVVAPSEVLELLSHHAALEGFLEPPIAAEPDIAANLALGDRLGPYCLVELLGEGGMGRVFLAEQEEPVQRRVALKVIRHDLGSGDARARFRFEQRALAQLVHPNIAQLYDAGTTPADQPYFAMEWVDGKPIDRYCDQKTLGLDARLELFMDVCSAVEYAHQKQLLHRDLKPSNVLVTDHGGAPIPKVIDFGIAKVLGTSRDAGIAATGERILGTPAFLSPEALRGEVDTRSDVYMLGVLLYRLLSGAQPFDDESRSLGELIIRIERGDAPPVHVAARNQASSSEPNGGVSPRTWAKRLRGDLAAVVAKAMHPDPEHRYGSVGALVADLERFQRHEPVQARRSGWGERFVLLVRRRRGAALAASLLLASLILGTIGTSIGMLEARREAHATRQALSEIQELSQFLGELFAVSDPARAQGAEVTARQLLDEGAKTVRARFADRPLTRARFTRVIGEIYSDLGLHDEARGLLEEAVALLEARHGAHQPAVGEALHSMAVLELESGNFDQARQLFEQVLSIQRAAPTSDAIQQSRTRYHLGVVAYRSSLFDEAEAHFERACPPGRALEGNEDLTARCLDAFGAMRFEQSRVREALPLIRASLALREQHLGPMHPHVAASLNSLCTAHASNNEVSLAEDACERALTIRRQALGNRHPDVGFSLSRLAHVYRLQKRYADAEGLVQEALVIAETALAPEHPWTARWLLASGRQRWLQGDYAGAESQYRKAFEIRQKSLGPDSPSTMSALAGVGFTRWKAGDFEAAESILLQVRQIQEQHFQEEHRQLAWVYWGLAGVYRDRHDQARNDLAKAEHLYDKALRIRRAAYPAEHEYRIELEADYQAYLQVVGKAPRSQSDGSEGVTLE